MTTSRVYLDHNATTPLLPEARTAMTAAMDLVGNPSSVHAEGRAARAVIEDAREAVATLVGASPAEVVFTASATEANATILAQRWDTILVPAIEHDSVLAAARASHANIETIGAAGDGSVDVGAIAARLLKGPPLGNALLTVQLANNETGVLQPVTDIAAFARAHGVAIHTDAVQAAGRLHVDIGSLGVDAMSLSAHKLGGPKGIGALIVRDGLGLSPLVPGGQERRRRGGTENVVAIAGFGAAARRALQTRMDWHRVAALRDRLEREAVAALPGSIVVAATSPRLPNTTLLAHPGLRSETTVIRLDLAGLSVSAGAACSSGKVGQSHVLAAMDLPPAIARSAVRVSLGLETTEDDVAAFLAAWRTLAPAAAVPHDHRKTEPVTAAG